MILLWDFHDTSCKFIRKVSFLYITIYQAYTTLFYLKMRLWDFFLLKKTNTHENCFAVILAIVLEWNTNKEDGNYKSPGLKFIYMVLSDKLQEKPFFDLNQQITPILPK